MLVKKSLLFCLLVASLVSTGLADDVPVPQTDVTPAPTWTLRYKFVSDQKLRYRNSENLTLDAMQGEIRKVDVTDLEQRRIFTVSSVDDSGAARFTMQYDFVRMQVQTNEYEPVVFDTTMKPDDVPPAFRMTAKQLKGSAPRFWISNLGSALKETDSPGGHEPAVKAIARAGNVTVKNKKPDAGVVQQAVATSTAKASDASMSSDTVTFLMPLPENAVAVGDTWREIIPVNVRITEEFSRNINILRTFRLESVEDGIATISFRASVEAAVKTPTMRSQLIKATPKGTLTLDIERGIMIKREIRYDETVLDALGPNSVVLCHGSSIEELQDDLTTETAAE